MSWCRQLKEYLNYEKTKHVITRRIHVTTKAEGSREEKGDMEVNRATVVFGDGERKGRLFILLTLSFVRPLTMSTEFNSDKPTRCLGSETSLSKFTNVACHRGWFDFFSKIVISTSAIYWFRTRQLLQIVIRNRDPQPLFFLFPVPPGLSNKYSFNILSVHPNGRWVDVNNWNIRRLWEEDSKKEWELWKATTKRKTEGLGEWRRRAERRVRSGTVVHGDEGLNRRAGVCLSFSIVSFIFKHPGRFMKRFLLLLFRLRYNFDEENLKPCFILLGILFIGLIYHSFFFVSRQLEIEAI